MGFLDRFFGPPQIDRLQAKRNVPGLIKALSYVPTKRESRGIPNQAAAALGKVGDARAVDPLIAIINSERPVIERDDLDDQKLYWNDLRLESARSLGMIGDVMAAEPLVNLAYQQMSMVNYYNRLLPVVVDALGSIRHGLARDLFLDILSDYNRKYHDSRPLGPDVFAKTALFLGSYSDKEVIDTLKQTVSEHRIDSISREAVKALGQIGDSSAIQVLVESLSDSGNGWYPTVIRALTNIDPNWSKTASTRAAIPTLMNNLVESYQHSASSERDHISSAIDAVGEIGDPQSVDPLIRFEEESGSFTSDICRALGRIGDKRALAFLIRKNSEYSTDKYRRYLRVRGEILDAIAMITGDGIVLKNVPAKEQLALAENPSTSSDKLERLAMSTDMSVVVAVAENASTSPDTLRCLNSAYNNEGQRLYYQFAVNPNCPSDLLQEIANFTVNESTRKLAREHPNFGKQEKNLK